MTLTLPPAPAWRPGALALALAACLSPCAAQTPPASPPAPALSGRPLAPTPGPAAVPADSPPGLAPAGAATPAPRPKAAAAKTAPAPWPQPLPPGPDAKPPAPAPTAAPWPQPPAPAPWPQAVPPAAPAAAPWPQPVAPTPAPQAAPSAAPWPQPLPRSGAEAPWPQPPAASGQPAPGGYAQRPEVQAWAEALQRSSGLPAEAIQAALREAEFQPRVTLLILPSGGGSSTAKDWSRYRARFVEPRRIASGQRFWADHASVLARAEAEFGVPAAVVVGILGVETLYGEQTGNYRVLDALATLGFDFPPARRDRSAFFREELGEFLRWCHREGIAPTGVYGSFAGAIGLPQFMPSSINKHARDYDGDGRIDLRASPVDAIGSVAHYLQRHGWQRGQPAFYPVEPPTEPEALAALLAPDILPSFSVADFQARGARLPAAAQAHAGKLALVSVDNGEGGAPTRVAGTENFYALTRYNWSSYYALAVLALGDAVASARGAGGGAATPWPVPTGPQAAAAPARPRGVQARAAQAGAAKQAKAGPARKSTKVAKAPAARRAPADRGKRPERAAPVAAASSPR